MNSTALSVRSIAVDFLISLLGGVYNEIGSIDEIVLVILTVTPEVVAREIGMYSASNKIFTMEDVERALWPLRRALGDVEGADPNDDDRVDPHLAPFLATLCRSCQAVVDGVLIELRLQGEKCDIVGSFIHVPRNENSSGKGNVSKDKVESSVEDAWFYHTFDADEESIYEAANSFLPETAPLQRLRWLLTLATLHESKGQWVEAAESLLLCARTIADALPHAKNLWRPSHFLLWYDARLSLWLPTVGSDSGDSQKDNSHVMTFAHGFLEPKSVFAGLVDLPAWTENGGKLYQPRIPVMCQMLMSNCKRAVSNYVTEEGVDNIAYMRLEELLKNIMGVVDNFANLNTKGGSWLVGDDARRKEIVEDSAALRRMSASLNSDMTRIAERMVLDADESSIRIESEFTGERIQEVFEATSRREVAASQFYARVTLLGRKPSRFFESTTIPTFLEWGVPSICRVKKKLVSQAISEQHDKVQWVSRQTNSDRSKEEELMCKAYAGPLITALSKDLATESIVLCSQNPSDVVVKAEGNKMTYVIITPVRKGGDDSSSIGAKRFISKNHLPNSSSLNREGSNINGRALKSFTSGYIESTVAQRFPCALSRQRSIITSEFISGNSDFHNQALYHC